jgi:hypothetical protein
MVGGARVALVATAAGVLAAGFGVAQAGGDGPPAASVAQGATPRLAIARFGTTAARGVVFAVRHGPLKRVGVGVSLHGLQPNRTFEVVGVRRGCSAAVEGEQIAASTVFRTTVQSLEVEDVWSPARAALRGSLAGTRSIRV